MDNTLRIQELVDSLEPVQLTGKTRRKFRRPEMPASAEEAADRVVREMSEAFRKALEKAEEKAN